MCFLLLRSDRKIGLSIFLRRRFLRRVCFHRSLQRVLLRRIPPMLRVSVLPPLRSSGTFLSRPVQSVLCRCPSYVLSTHEVVLYSHPVLFVCFLFFPS